ncbi:MAG: nucleotidyl transferase AbiEii/AbiGii toxin family protein [Sphaerochaeta sp.]
MDRQSQYFRQVALLVQVMPAIFTSRCFALKGGTAINLFYRDMPRLSVDIDLVYVPLADRVTSLEEITQELTSISDRIRLLIPQVSIRFSRLNKTEYVTRLMVESNQTLIKIEVSPVLRGVVFQPQKMRIRETAEKAFGFVEIPVVSFEDLYAGKILAALDRQHPRDLFDIHYLLANEGITPRLKEAFIVYLISHNRRFLEILSPSLLDIRPNYLTNFEGMSTVPVEISVLEETRVTLIEEINSSLHDADKQFLLGFKEGDPDWSYFSVPHIKNLPAVLWKQYNLQKISFHERKRMVEELARHFEK